MTIAVRSGAEMNALLKKLDNKIRARVLGKMVLAGARVFRKAARKNAPYKTGALRRNIKTKKGPRSRVRKTAQVVMGSRSSMGIKPGRAHYGFVQEFGSRKRSIPKIAFMGRAFEENEKKVIKMFEKAIRDALNEVTRG